MSNVPEYKVLVGENTGGDFVHTQQGTAKKEGFSHVSQFWYPKTISFEEAIANIEKERLNRRDIEGFWQDWQFVVSNKQIKFMDPDGLMFIPTPHALTQSMRFCEVCTTHLNQVYLEPKVAPDEIDLQQLCDTLNHRKQHHHIMKSGEPRELLFRTYSDNTLRAVLTPSYAPIDNRWFLGMMSDLIPGGRLSHQRGDADTLFANILMPDNVRDENDGQYGGMISIRNSEIGQASLDCLVALFRSICQNGCIWSRKNGVSFRQVHLGDINLETLALEIGDNVNKQIPLLPSIMDSFLALRQNEFKDVKITHVLAQVALDNQMTGEQAKAMLEEWNKNEGRIRTPFAVINAITRMSQKYDAFTCNKFDLLGGTLISADWNLIAQNARGLKDENVVKILGLSV